MKFFAQILFFLLAPVILWAQVPAGTILPAMLTQTIDAEHAHVGQRVVARVMQDVQLPDGARIPARSKLVGEIARVDRNRPDGTQVSLRFNAIEVHGRSEPVATALRALASYFDVDQAQIPPIGDNRAVPYDENTFVLIGGDVSYRGGGPVTHASRVVGTPSGDGVLVSLLANPQRGCTSSYDTSRAVQSLWLFSSNACGIYGLPHVSVVHRGIHSGEITFSSQRDVKLHSGDGLLLTVIAPAR